MTQFSGINRPACVYKGLDKIAESTYCPALLMSRKGPYTLAVIVESSLAADDLVTEGK